MKQKTIISQEDGVERLRIVLEGALPKTVISVAPGIFPLHSPLVVPSGVSVQGAGAKKTVFTHDFDGPAIIVERAQDVRLSCFSINTQAVGIVRRTLPEDQVGDEDAPEKVRIEWGLIFINDGQSIGLERISLTNKQKEEPLLALVARNGTKILISKVEIQSFGGAGILLLGTKEATISSCTVANCHRGIDARVTSDGFRNVRALLESNSCHGNTQFGIGLSSTEADCVRDNDCWSNGFGGIVLLRDVDAPNLPSRGAVVENNRCHNNSQSGIILFSSECKALRDNDCWENGDSGIVLLRDPDAPDQPSHAILERNRCHENAKCGIILFSSESERIHENKCWENGASGIVLKRDSLALDQPSRAILERNRCHRNARSGIVLFSSESEAVSENECYENGNAGIHLQRDPWASDQPSRAIVEHNSCHNNTGGGIVLASSQSRAIRENDCWGNGRSGITLQRDSNPQNQPSLAVVKSNRCHDNKKNGITLFSSVSEGVLDNECWGNGTSGIVLSRDSDASDQPSRAIVAGNRCHDNTQAGIILYSSESERVRDNDCWGNGYSGIILSRDYLATDQPSRAVIAANRCHDNSQSGIILFSSESESVSENDCWGNGRSGIVLQRDPDTSDQPSRAIVAGNRCHDNTKAGIILNSSESEGVRDNDCWGNGYSGIILSRDYLATDQPSRAVVENNRCHDNTQFGIGLFSSESEGVRDNECWGNGLSGIYLGRQNDCPGTQTRALVERNRCFWNRSSFGVEIGSELRTEGNIVFGNREPPKYRGPDGHVLHPLDWDLIQAQEAEDQTWSRLRGKLSSGSLATKLEAAGIREPDCLARFLCGHGAIDDLKRWLGKAQILRPEFVAEEPRDVGVFRYSETGSLGDGSEPVLHFDAVSSNGLRDLVWDIATDHVQKDKRGTHLVGAFGQLEDEISRIVSEAENVNSVNVDSVGEDMLAGRHNLVRELTMSGTRVVQPLVCDYLARSEDALSQIPQLLPFLEPNSPRGVRLLRGWLAFVLGSRRLMGSLLLCSTACFATAVAVGAWKGFPAPLNDPFGAAFHAMQSAIIAYELPQILVLPLAIPAGFAALIASLNKWVPVHLAIRLRSLSAQEHPRRGSPWRDWVRRRVFGGGNISLVVLKSQQEWHDDDRAALRELIRMRPKDVTLVVVIAAPTRATLDRSLLRSLSGSDGKLDLPECVELLAALGPEPKPLNIGNTEGAPNIEPLLGLEKGASTARCEMAKSSIRAPGFSMSDLIPMMALGSTHLHPFAITRSAEESYAQFGPEFQKTFNRYGRVFSADPDFSLDLSGDVDRINRWIDEARISSACVLMRQTKGRETHYRILGRYQRRSAMLAALKSDPELFGQDRENLEDYLHAMLSCGQVRALEDVRFLLKEIGPKPALNRAFFALYSAILLRSETLDLNTSSSERRDEMIAAEWDATLGILDAMRGSESSTNFVTLARLYAVSCHVRSVDAGKNKSGSKAAYDAFVDKALAKFDILDRELAFARAEADLFPIMKILPQADRDRLGAQCELKRRRGSTLADILATSDSKKEMHDILARHASLPDDGMIATLLSTAARSVSSEEEAVQLGMVLQSIRMKLSSLSPQARPHGYAGRRISKPSLLLKYSSALLADAENLPKAESSLHNSRTQIELMYGNFESIFGGIQNLARIEIR